MLIKWFKNCHCGNKNALVVLVVAYLNFAVSKVSYPILAE